METLKELLENPFEGLKGKPQEFQKKCDEIANKLFKNYCIECGIKQFYFAEIEFYYYDTNDFKEEWNIVTYARDGYDAGTLFYHLSGVDICFKSHYNESSAQFGGILIRSLPILDNDKNKKYITGPLNCKDELLNACKGCCMPRIVKRKTQLAMSPKATKRLLGETAMLDNVDGNYNLCFYDGNIENWDTERIWYDKRKGEIKKITKKYSIERNIPIK